ncbi:cellulose binding domain-containing protein [Micromonospora zhanjiangensis]|uniref:Cellulose binding domain-containing protein n=1 Tax=Micromonospora zhanjiangensis TaxID=1522057 RepID=A0ABV8KNK8_9ACTN
MAEDRSGLQVYSKVLNGTGRRAVLLLNRTGAAASITARWSDLGLSGTATVRNPWTGTDLGTSASSYTTSVPANEAVLLTVSTGSTTPPPTTPPPTTPPPTTPPPTTPPPTTPPPTTPPGQSGSCAVDYAVNAWNTGLTASIKITNRGTSAINGWTLSFTLPGGQTITSGWNATYSGSAGPVTARNVAYNATLAPGGSTDIGFQATHTGNTAEPTSFTLNNTPCTLT